MTALLSEEISITGPSPVSLVSSITSSNIVCAGQEDGRIEFTITGGVAPYFYSLTGGIPDTQFSNGNKHIEENLAPGQYTVIIKDSTSDQCDPISLSQTIIITEPVGGPLELNEGSITGIPCQNDGFGSFEVNISGGSNQN